MSVLDRRITREMLRSRGQMLALAGIMAIGVACFVALSSTHFNLTRAQRDYYTRCRMADFTVDLSRMPRADARRLTEIPGVAEVRPRLRFRATVDLEGAEHPINGLVLSLPRRRTPVLNDVVIRRGTYFTSRRDNEVIVNDTFARRHQIGPGDTLRLVVNNRSQELRVTGTAISSEFAYLVGSGSIIPDPEHFGVFYLKRRYAEQLLDFEGACNEVLGHLVPSARERPALPLELVEERLAAFGVLQVTPREIQPSHQYLSNEIQILGIVSRVLPLIFLSVAALVMNVLLIRLTEQQRTVIGTLKALGYSDWQLFRQLLKLGFLLGLGGGVAGCLLGAWLASLLTDVYNDFFEFPDLISRWLPGMYATGITISLACALAGTFLGARKVLGLAPAEAMRPRAPVHGRTVLLERWGWLWRGLGSRWRLSLRVLGRNPVRSGAGTFACTMGAGLLICASILDESLLYFVRFQFEKVLRSDIDATFADARGGETRLLATRLEGVGHVEPILDVACHFVNGPYEKRGNITGLVPGARLTIPHDADGDAVPIPPAGLVMTRRLADTLHLEAGDPVDVRPIEGRRVTRKVQVARLLEGYLGIPVYADMDYLRRLIGADDATTRIQFETDGAPGSESALYHELKSLPSLEAVTARSIQIESLVSTLIEVLRVVTRVLVVFAGMIFFGSLLNSSLISLTERRQEMATLHAMGYSAWHIGGLLLRENSVTVLLGTVLGIPVGYALSLIVADAYDTELFRLPLITPASVWWRAFLLAGLFGLVSQAVTQWNVHRTDWSETLNLKE